MTYSEKLKDPRWQRKRLEILQRDGFKCCDCESTTKTLHVHHRYYVSHRLPWEYPGFCYQTMCEDCHDTVKEIIESNRQGDELGAPIIMWSDWEAGLDYFGERIFDMFDDCQMLKDFEEAHK